jgi:hypothetical protein
MLKTYLKTAGIWKNWAAGNPERKSNGPKDANHEARLEPPMMPVVTEDTPPQRR